MMVVVSPRASTTRPAEVERATALFGSAPRIQIVRLLHTDAPASKAHIAETLGMDSKTVNYHLAKLEEIGAVVSDPPPGPERRGQRPLCSVDELQVKVLSAAALDYLLGR